MLEYWTELNMNLLIMESNNEIVGDVGDNVLPVQKYEQSEPKAEQRCS